MLGHEGSIATSLSYANLVVSFATDRKVYETAPEDLIRTLIAEIDDFKARLAKLESTKLDAEVRMNLDVEAATVKSNEVGFIKPDGTILRLPRHQKRKFAGIEDMMATIDVLAQQLEEADIPLTRSNLQKLALDPNRLHSSWSDFQIVFPDRN